MGVKHLLSAPCLSFGLCGWVLAVLWEAARDGEKLAAPATFGAAVWQWRSYVTSLSCLLSCKEAVVTIPVVG